MIEIKVPGEITIQMLQKFYERSGVVVLDFQQLEPRLQFAADCVAGSNGDATQEDHLSMACHGARRLLQMTDNLFNILGIEALAAAQGVDFRQPLKTGDRLMPAYNTIRAAVPRLVEDRYMADDLTSAASIVSSGKLAMTLEATIRDRLEI